MLTTRLIAILDCGILAQGDRFSDLGGRFRDGGADLPIAQIGVLVVVIVLTIVGLSAVAHRNAIRERRGYSDFRQLFKQLCRLHDIDWSNRRLLSQLAKMHGLAHPAELFLTPSRFNVASLSPELKSQTQQIQALRRRIFDEPVQR